MPHMAVCAGLRVSELRGLKIDDIDMSSMTIRLSARAEGTSAAVVKKAAKALRAWLAIRGKVATPKVFVSERGEPLSRWGFRRSNGLCVSDRYRCDMDIAGCGRRFDHAIANLNVNEE
jgi:site-specific recombinase XerC